LGYHGSSLDRILIQADRIQSARVSRRRRCSTRWRAGIGRHRCKQRKLSPAPPYSAALLYGRLPQILLDMFCEACDQMQCSDATVPHDGLRALRKPASRVRSAGARCWFSAMSVGCAGQNR